MDHSQDRSRRLRRWTLPRPVSGSYGCCLPDDKGHTEMVCTNQNSGYGFKSGDDTMSTVTANGVSYCGDFTLDGMRMGTPNPYSSGNSIGRNGENEFYDLMCIGGVMSTVTYHSFEGSYGFENQWSIGECSGRNANGGVDYPEGVEPDYAGTTATFTAECCIPYSSADLTCIDTYNDGWDGNYLTIDAFPSGGPDGDGTYCLGTDNGDDTWTFHSVLGGDTAGIACDPYAADEGGESRCATQIVLPVGDLPESCYDRLQNQGETDVDCGGDVCGACNGESCDMYTCLNSQHTNKGSSVSCTSATPTCTTRGIGYDSSGQLRTSCQDSRPNGQPWNNGHDNTFFSSSTCGAAIITDEAVCQTAAAGLSKPWESTAGSDWESGCIVHGGKVYFSPFEDGSTDTVPDGGYICKGGCEKYVSEGWCTPSTATAGRSFQVWTLGAGYNNPEENW